jgi:hypothetical protein
MNKQELQKKITELRTEIRTDYDKIGLMFYEIVKAMDEYLEYINNSLEKKDGNI